MYMAYLFIIVVNSFQSCIIFLCFIEFTNVPKGPCNYFTKVTKEMPYTMKLGFCTNVQVLPVTVYYTNL